MIVTGQGHILNDNVCKALGSFSIFYEKLVLFYLVTWCKRFRLWLILEGNDTVLATRFRVLLT